MLSYFPFWVSLTLLIFSKLRNEFSTLLIISFIYLLSFLFFALSGGEVFNNYWFVTKSSNAIYYWMLSFVLVYLLNKLSILLFSSLTVTERFTKGVFAIISKKLGFNLSMFHYRMLGLSSQKVLWFFSF